MAVEAGASVTRVELTINLVTVATEALNVSAETCSVLATALTAATGVRDRIGGGGRRVAENGLNWGNTKNKLALYAPQSDENARPGVMGWALYAMAGGLAIRAPAAALSPPQRRQHPGVVPGSPVALVDLQQVGEPAGDLDPMPERNRVRSAGRA